MNTETIELIEALQRRDEAALAHVFDTHANKIYRIALGVLQDEQQADGVVQDTFIKLIENIDHFEGKSKLGTWLYRIAYNEALQRLRRDKPHLNLANFEDQDFLPTCLVDWQMIPEDLLNSHEAALQMEQAISQLSAALRSVFILRDVEEFSTHETSKILGISESAVKVRLHRARLNLRERLANYFKEYDAS